MLIEMIVRRMWRERRQMAILLLAMCLVTGFMALEPLLVRAISEAAFELRLQSLTPVDQRIDLINSGRIEDDAHAALEETLGARLGDITRFITSIDLLCGFGFSAPTPDDLQPRFRTCLRPYAYESGFNARFTVVEGRVPQPREDRIVEIAFTRQVMDDAAYLHPGFAFNIGDQFNLVSETDQITLELVGVLQPTQPETDRSWDGQEYLFGGIVLNIDRPDELYIGAVMLPEAYETFMPLFATGSQSVWRAPLSLTGLRAADLVETRTNLSTLRSRLLLTYPDLEVRAGLDDLIAEFQENVRRVESPVLMLAVLILALMLYNLITTVALILEQQGREWAMMASRGASTRQLTQIQLMTVIILGLIAFVLGPVIAQGALLLLTVIGPQAVFLEPSHLNTLPVEAFLLSGISALAAVIALTLPAVPMARGSFLRLRQAISRPPSRPVWSRYFLDLILLLAGAAFTLRAYTLTGINDFFSLAGPVLLLTGLALLWMRLFPLLMRGLGSLLSGFNALSVRLALWTVERDPGHYAQLVLLLIGTLALGTASLAINHTRNNGAWDTARETVGADVRLLRDVRQNIPRADLMNAVATLPTVTQSMPMTVITSDVPPSPPALLFGVDLERAAAFAELTEIVTPLAAAPPAAFPGTPLPSDTAALKIDLYSRPNDLADIPRTRIVMQLMDANGVRVPITLLPANQEDIQAVNQWVTYQGQITTEHGEAPWRLIGIAFASARRSDQRFENTVFIDNLQGILADGSSVLLDDFEPDSVADWTRFEGNTQFNRVLLIDANTELKTQGEYSFRIVYSVTVGTDAPALSYRVVQPEMPVVISAAFAERYGQRLGLDRPLQVGDRVTSNLDLPVSSLHRAPLPLTYTVVSIVEEFPTMSANDPFLIAPLDALLMQVNVRRRQDDAFGVNQLWADMVEREPSQALRDSLAAIPGITNIELSWDVFNEIQREPLSNAVSGLLFAWFWVSTALILLDFAFYLSVALNRRATWIAALRSMGMEQRGLWRMLSVEQAAFMAPALVVGVLLGAGIGTLILPFLNMVGGLQIPLIEVILLLTILIIIFTLILTMVAAGVQRKTAGETLRFGE